MCTVVLICVQPNPWHATHTHTCNKSLRPQNVLATVQCLKQLPEESMESMESMGRMESMESMESMEKRSEISKVGAKACKKSTLTGNI